MDSLPWKLSLRHIAFVYVVAAETVILLNSLKRFYIIFDTVFTVII